MATTIFPSNSFMVSSTSDVFAFPCLPTPTTKRKKTAHVRQPMQASFHTAMPHRKAAPLPLPIFKFPCQMASTSETKDEGSLPAPPRHHRRSQAISVPSYDCRLQRQAPLSALPKHLVSRPSHALHHPPPQKKSSPLQFQLHNDQLYGYEHATHEHTTSLVSDIIADSHIAPHTHQASELLFYPREPSDTSDSAPTTSACPTLIPDHSPLPTPDTRNESHNPMDIDTMPPAAADTNEDIPPDFESFKRSLGAILGITITTDDEDDDDELWQCRDFAASQQRKDGRVLQWMRDCEDGDTV